jgi:hypothetical protein
MNSIDSRHAISINLLNTKYSDYDNFADDVEADCDYGTGLEMANELILNIRLQRRKIMKFEHKFFLDCQF